MLLPQNDLCCWSSHRRIRNRLTSRQSKDLGADQLGECKRQALLKLRQIDALNSPPIRKKRSISVRQ